MSAVGWKLEKIKLFSICSDTYHNIEHVVCAKSDENQLSTNKKINKS